MAKEEAPDSYEVLRTRAHWKREDAQRVLSDWSSSGESMSAFARRHRLGLHRLQWWRKQLEAPADRSLRLVPAVAAAAPLIALEASTAVCSVHIEVDGTRIEINDPHRTDPHWLAALVSQLRGARS